MAHLNVRTEDPGYSSLASLIQASVVRAYERPPRRMCTSGDRVSCFNMTELKDLSSRHFHLEPSGVLCAIVPTA